MHRGEPPAAPMPKPVSSTGLGYDGDRHHLECDTHLHGLRVTGRVTRVTARVTRVTARVTRVTARGTGVIMRSSGRRVFAGIGDAHQGKELSRTAYLLACRNATRAGPERSSPGAHDRARSPASPLAFRGLARPPVAARAPIATLARLSKLADAKSAECCPGRCPEAFSRNSSTRGAA
jgi:hypothetical protein